MRINHSGQTRLQESLHVFDTEQNKCVDHAVYSKNKNVRNDYLTNQ